MQAAILDDRTGRNTSFLASLTMHLLVGTALLFVPLTRRHFAEPEEPVPVAIVVAAPPQAPPSRQAPTPVPDALPPGQPEDGKAGLHGADRPDARTAAPASLPSPGAEAKDGLITARTMLSDGALANPRSRKARQQLRTFSADERVVQLCNIEAMEQVHAMQPALLPEAVSPYAFQDLKLHGGSVVADGAAFYSGQRWYGLRFACDVTAGKVVSFAFRIGQPVPRPQWEEHNLAEPLDDDE
jgi:hypothetical protein